MTKQIFIIEDDGDFSQQLESLSNRLGYGVSREHTDELELEDVTAQSPVLVIICQSGENESGYNWCRSIKSADAELPVILIVEPSEFESARLEQHKHSPLCADAYLPIPLDGQTFIDTISDQLDLEATEIENRYLEIVVGGDQKKNKSTVNGDVDNVFDGDDAGVTEDEAEQALNALLQPEDGDISETDGDGSKRGTIVLTDEDIDEELLLDDPSRGTIALTEADIDEAQLLDDPTRGTIALTDEELYGELVLEELPLEDELLVAVSEGGVTDPEALKAQIAELQRALNVAHQSAAQRAQDIVSLKNVDEQTQNELRVARRNNTALTRELESLKKIIESSSGSNDQTSAKAEVDHTRKLETLQAEHLSEVLEMQREHARVVVSLEEEFTAREKRILSDRDREHQVTIDALQAKHKESIENAKKRSKEEHSAIREHAEEQADKLTKEHSTAFEALNREHAAAIEELRASHTKQIETMTGNHESQVEAHLRAERDTSATIKTNLEGKLSALAEKHEKAIHSQKTKFEKKLEKLQTKHASTQENQARKHEEQLEKIKAKQVKKLDGLTARHEKQLEKLVDKHEKALEKTSALHEQRIAGFEAEIAIALAAAQAAQEKHLSEMESLGVERDAVQAELKAAQAERSKIDKELAKTSRKLGQLTTKHETATAELKQTRKDLKKSKMDLANEQRARADDLIELEAKHADLKAAFQIDTERKETLERAIDGLNSELAAQEKKLASTAAETRKAQKENESLRASLDEIQSRATEREANFAKLRTAIAVANVFAEELTDAEIPEVEEDGEEAP